VALAVLEGMLARPRASGLLDVWLRHTPVAADADGDRVRAVTLLPLAGVEYVTGFESQSDTGGPDAVEGDAQPDNVQALSWVMALGHDPDGEYVIDRPAQYQRWRDFDRPAHPFQIPMGALIPQRVDNLLPASKNIGTTHLTNSSYRLHPVEWNIGESSGLLAAFCVRNRKTPRQVRHNPEMLREFQDLCTAQGIELEWPQVGPENRNASFDKRVLGTLPRGATP
jgi:hypothetical protein